MHILPHRLRAAAAVSLCVLAPSLAWANPGAARADGYSLIFCVPLSLYLETWIVWYFLTQDEKPRPPGGWFRAGYMILTTITFFAFIWTADWLFEMTGWLLLPAEGLVLATEFFAVRWYARRQNMRVYNGKIFQAVFLGNLMSFGAYIPLSFTFLYWWPYW